MAAPLMPLLCVLQITSGSTGKEVLTSIFSATAETLSTSTTTHVTKVRAAPEGAAGGFLMKPLEFEDGWISIVVGTAENAPLLLTSRKSVCCPVGDGEPAECPVPRSERPVPCSERPVPGSALLHCLSHPARHDRWGLQARTAGHQVFITCIAPTGTVNTCCAHLSSLVDWEGRESSGREGRAARSVTDLLKPTAGVEGTQN